MQALLFLITPRRLALALVFLMVRQRVLTIICVRYGLLHDSGYDLVRLGRTTAQVPDPDGSLPTKTSDKEIVVFCSWSPF